MSYLRVEHLSLSLDEPTELEDDGRLLKAVSFDAEKGEIIGILGASGAGKSLLLRALLGLVPLQEGRIFKGGEDITERAPSQRGMAYLSQRLALYPHLSGEVNAGFFYWIRGLVKKTPLRFHPVVGEILSELGISEERFLQRKPRSLAGGERQRVALARALASEAEVLLLDEPLANIEDHFRDVLRHFLRRWLQQRGQTALVVSHNQEEMAGLCDRLFLMDQGVLIQKGSYDELCTMPLSRITALFMGRVQKNYLSAEMIESLWGKKVAWDAVVLPSLARQTKESEWDLEVKGTVIMIENFFAERKKLLCVEFHHEMFFYEVGEDFQVKKGERICFYLPLQEAWLFERNYPYRRIYQGEW